jgi:hypothetical protein
MRTGPQIGTVRCCIYFRLSVAAYPPTLIEAIGTRRPALSGLATSVVLRKNRRSVVRYTRQVCRSALHAFALSAGAGNRNCRTRSTYTHDQYEL